MTQKEFAQFAMAMRTYYPKEKLLPNTEAMELWYEMLKDIPYDVAKATLNKWITENKWSPTIADIREVAAEVKHGRIPDWGEGWNQVQRMIKKYGSYNVGTAMSEMDELTRHAVRRLGFTELCMSETPEVDRANFRMIYEQLADRKKVDRQTSREVHIAISNIQRTERIGNDTEFIKIGSFLGENDGRN